MRPTAESEAGAVVENSKPVVFRQSVRAQHPPVEISPPHNLGAAFEHRAQPLDEGENPRRGRHTLLIICGVVSVGFEPRGQPRTVSGLEAIEDASTGKKQKRAGHGSYR